MYSIKKLRKLKKVDAARKGVNMENEKKEKKRVTIYMDKQILEDLKIQAIKKETSVSALVEKMAEEILGREQ